ncbi:hypothetical protein MWU52_12505 [Jannaschia sp. S6380]|uniref:hypothetical protein n=1 Tax=Jannaschia sp. S6380 TaxID=2926408 RepID=UPI001FF1D0F3|nr:hypothetical protein [Jannaschia sp. S6380]MCK0168378.1 hypothetical protein [Jannaschia sp. S6380]
MPDQDPLAPRRLRSLGNYDWPTMPRDEAVQRVWADLRAVFDRAEPDAPLIEPERLGHLGPDRLDEVARPPACQPILDDMTHSYAEWLARPSQAARVQVAIMPPGGDPDVVESWAAAHGLELRHPPARHLLIERPGPDAPDLSGSGVLVLPRLEAWFLRDAAGLDTVRALVDAIVASDRRILIGCGSWAWAYLTKAVDAALLLPSAYTFQAFDGARLQAWLCLLSRDARSGSRRFRLADTGADVFEDPEERRTRDWFNRLAARSLGIPWIAWAMWRAALSDLRPDEDGSEVPAGLGDDDTYWIAHADDFALPPSNRQSALLSLHALLIHGALPAPLLHRVLPLPDTDAVIPALIETGHVLRDSHVRPDVTMLRVNPVAYPAIRSALGNAGFPRDRL